MITILKLMITNLIGMLMTKHMIIWGLKFAVKQTDNKIDDNIVLFVEGAYSNDSEAIKVSVSNLTKIYNNNK